MATALILTVGSSHQPILASIRQHNPDRVYFLCSDDQGKTKGSYVQVDGPGKVLKSDLSLEAPDQPCIVEQAQLRQGQFHVERVGRFDDLDECYLKATKVIGMARKALPGARLVADYTGGTKSMSAGLVAAALDDGGCDLALVTGQRLDLFKVANRTEFARRVPVGDTQVHRRLLAARDLAARYDYAAAEQVLRAAAAELTSASNLEPLQRGISLCQAFDAWDRFEHGTARDCLQAYSGDFVPHWRVLKALCGEKPHGFEWVEDLLLNADRRRAQSRFDDAVGRVYRAIELLAQVWLKERYKVNTSDVDLGVVPEAVRTRLERHREGDETGKPGKVKIGLSQAWELIAAYPEDPLGASYAQAKNRLQNFLPVRNMSLFAHGQRPITRGDYDRHVPALQDWARSAVEAGLAELGRKRAVKVEQFPTDFLIAAP